MKPGDVETTIRKIVANAGSIEIGVVGDIFSVKAPLQSPVRDASLLAALQKMEESAQSAEDAWQRRRARLRELGLEDGDLYIAPATQILRYRDASGARLDPAERMPQGAMHDAFEIRRVDKDPSFANTSLWGTSEEINALVTSLERGEPGATLNLRNCAYQVWDDRYWDDLLDPVETHDDGLGDVVDGLAAAGIRQPRYTFYLPEDGKYSAEAKHSQVLAMLKCWRARGPVDETHEDAGYPPIC